MPQNKIASWNKVNNLNLVLFRVSEELEALHDDCELVNNDVYFEA